ncbi:MAG: isoleucine--tRNA ligase [Candidatus Aenigmarchaeota archaeon]|nr:isoleucine--tRNA ligase [Candidatus Aenigmarchaeota archaeon]
MSFKIQEEKILNFWEENKIYYKQKEKLKNKKIFYFLDGPPYATGYIHMGTALNKILKDFFIRIYKMYGFNVWDQAGYDTHGLPIEYQVEKQLNFKSKKDIENFGIENFIKECKNFATKFIGVMNSQFKNLGVWMNFDNPYLTLTNEYIEGAWYTFKEAYKKGYLFKGFYPVHICPRCETVLAYNEIEYEELEDPSIYVLFKLKEEDKYLIIWTTTPWTLVDNEAIMVKPSAKYVEVKVDDKIYIVAKDLLEKLAKEFNWANYEIIREFEGKELEFKEYEHPFSDLLEFDKSNIYKVILSERFVSLTEGSGLVHAAPAHGKEDYIVCKEYNLPIINSVNINGTFNFGIFKDKTIKEVNEIVIKILRERNALLKEEKIKHEYPICWRCKSPLYIITIHQWFFKVTEFRDKLLEEIEKVVWYPNSAKYRMKDWLQNLSDWPISRQRYWGIPLPIWECKNCGNIKVIGSVKELGIEIEDLHRPYIDRIKLKCERCKSEMERIKDVLDVWFDSGVAPWASIGLHKNKKLFKKFWPVQLEIEGPDQIRGWWNSQIITSYMTLGEAPYRRIVMHGFVLDAHGRKMSKSLGNIVAPEEIIDKYGRDVLRAYFLLGFPWEDYYFDWKEVEEINRKLNIIRNVFNFIKLYVNKKPEKKNLKIEDKYILSKLHSLILQYNQALKNYELDKLFVLNKKFFEFLVEDVSRFYIKIIRDRVWINYNGKDKEGALYTLLEILDKSLKILAPITPFLAEYYYQEISFIKNFESVHLENYPKPKKSFIKSEIENIVEVAKKIIQDILEARNKAKIKIRQPLKKVIIVYKKEEIKNAKKAKRIISILTNIKKIEFKDSFEAKEDYEIIDTENYTVYLYKKIDKKLKEEGILREIIREIQEVRKKENLSIFEKINIAIDISNEEFKKLIEKHKEIIESETNSILFFEKASKYELDLDGIKIFIEIKK